MYTHLNTHSYYSFLDGVLSPDQLVQCAVEQGMRSLCLTDFNNLTGAVEFYDSCHKEGIKPLLGLELKIHHTIGNGNLVLIGSNNKSWGNLCRLSSLVMCREKKDPSQGINLLQLAELSEGLICLCGGKRGLITNLLASKQNSNSQMFLCQLRDIFKDQLYISLQIQHPSDQEIVRQLVVMSQQNKLPLVATSNVYYQTIEQARLQRTLSAIRDNTPLTALPVMASAPVGSFFTTGDCMVHRFEELPKAITNTQEIAERCNLELPVGIPHFPEITCQNGETAISILRRLAERGAVKKYGKITPQIRERIDHELQVIDSRGYAPLFLIVQDIMEFAQKSGIPTSSRGSAASSLVAYCLGITTPDPLALNLYFERFLNPSRSTPPDIDIDLCSKRRDKVIAYVYEQYGKNRVAMVATVNRFQKRSALREVSKAYGLTTAEINQLINSLPSGSRKPSNLRKNKAKNTFEMMVVRYPGAKYQAIFHDAKAILGFPRHLSIHPGGIVIAPDVITNLVPTQLANKGIIITQFDLDSVERLGLVKIDLLGTRGLSVLGDVAEKIHQWCPIEYSSSLSVLESITDEDQETIELLKATQTIGCFSIESPGMRATLQEIQAKSPEDIMIALALYRPGPMTGGLKNVFVRRHLGQEPVEHIHPSLVSLLGNTNGIILYQEQVLRIASEMAGLSLSDADLLRRAMSHFDPGDQMRTLKVRFVDGAQSKSSVPIETAEKIWDLMAAFAGYGFPKAHAASYAQVAWRSVWCKAHYPAEFLAAVLAGWGGYYRQHVYIHEARRLGLKIYPPHINHSTHQFTATYLNGIPALYMGLDQVLDLSQETQKRIMARNPFHSLNEFLTQVDPSPKEAQNLIRVGALRGLGAIPDLLAQVISRDWRLSQPRLLEIVREHISGEDWSLSQRVDAQEKILGIGLDAHPIELVYQKLGNIGVISTREARKRINNDIRVAGIRQTIQRFHAPDGKVFYSLELDDPTGVITVHLSEAQYQQNRKILSTRTPFIIHGEMVIDPLTQVACLDARKVESLPAS